MARFALALAPLRLLPAVAVLALMPLQQRLSTNFMSRRQSVRNFASATADVLQETMAKLVVCCLLLAASAALLGSQTVQAKPFLKLNFFTLTTRAPTAGSSSTYQSTSNFQIPDFITPKLQFLTSLLQLKNFGTASGTASGTVSGTANGNFNYYKQYGPAPAATTTSSLAKTTEVATVYVPESTAAVTTRRTTTEAPEEPITASNIFRVQASKIVTIGNRDGAVSSTDNTVGSVGGNGGNGGPGGPGAAGSDTDDGTDTDTDTDTTDNSTDTNTNTSTGSISGSITKGTGSAGGSGVLSGSGLLSGTINGSGRGTLKGGTANAGTVKGSGQLNGYVYKGPSSNEISTASY